MRMKDKARVQFLSAQVSKKMGLELKSTKADHGQRIYGIES